MKNKKFAHRRVLNLAIPMILTNISTPLLGLVDTAVLGHLDSEQYLAAVALGSLIFSFIFWGFGFLRMGTTGLTAQAVGENNDEEVYSILYRANILALIIASLLMFSQNNIATLSFWLIQSSDLVEQLAKQYFAIRIWGSPAALCTYALLGWFLGKQNVRLPLLIIVATNITNICLDIVFVYHFKMQVIGVAYASVIAEYTGLFIGLIVVICKIKKQTLFAQYKTIFNLKKFKAMLLINSHIFIRTWCLIFTFAFFTAQGAKMGDAILAANTVLLNFQTFMAYALDGFAHATEALVGKAVGAKNKKMFKQAILTSAIWSLVVAIVFSLIYVVFGSQLIAMLTSLENIKLIANEHLLWVIIMPLVAFVCYLLDGVFIGAMMTREMRNTMIFSLFGVFIPVWYFTQDIANHGLWIAMIAFLVARGVSMLLVLNYKCKGIAF